MVTHSNNCISGNSDYESINVELTFNSTSNVSCFDVLLNDDSIIENSEIFLMELSTDDLAVSFPSISVPVEITDNDGKRGCSSGGVSESLKLRKHIMILCGVPV